MVHSCRPRGEHGSVEMKDLLDFQHAFIRMRAAQFSKNGAIDSCHRALTSSLPMPSSAALKSWGVSKIAEEEPVFSA